MMRIVMLPSMPRLLSEAEPLLQRLRRRLMIENQPSTAGKA
jgi:hypothetical protein